MFLVQDRLRVCESLCLLGPTVLLLSLRKNTDPVSET